jgi:hypothetical protein
MGLLAVINIGKKRFTIADVASDEIAMIALAFLVAKYFTFVTSLMWYWYVLIMVLFLIKPLVTLINGANTK